MGLIGYCRHSWKEVTNVVEEIFPPRYDIQGKILPRVFHVCTKCGELREQCRRRGECRNQLGR